MAALAQTVSASEELTQRTNAARAMTNVGHFLQYLRRRVLWDRTLRVRGRYQTVRPLLHPPSPRGSGPNPSIPLTPAGRRDPNLARTALIFEMLLEDLNFRTSISHSDPALINAPHLSWRHAAPGPRPARQLCFRIMGKLHPSPNHGPSAMIVHLSDLSVRPLHQEGQQGTG